MATGGECATVSVMTEHLFVEEPCLDCQAIVSFVGPGDGTCPHCGLRMYLTADGQVG